MLNLFTAIPYSTQMVLASGSRRAVLPSFLAWLMIFVVWFMVYSTVSVCCGSGCWGVLNMVWLLFWGFCLFDMVFVVL
jgi:hypothetical protein